MAQNVIETFDGVFSRLIYTAGRQLICTQRMDNLNIRLGAHGNGHGDLNICTR